MGVRVFSGVSCCWKAPETHLRWTKPFSEDKLFGGQVQTDFSKKFEEKDVADCFPGNES
jgi:hypothetical protein